MSEPTITALVLCGGLGTRLRPVVNDVPKALAPVGGEPFIGYLLRYLERGGVREIVLCTGYGADQLEQYCGDGSRWNVSIRYSIETSPLGTGGALKNAERFADSDPLLVLNGDSFVEADLRALQSYHAAKSALATMVVTHVPDQSRFGGVRIGSQDQVEGFIEKGSSGAGWINAGMYLMTRSIITGMPAGREISLEREILPAFVNNGMFAMKTTGAFIDIGTPASYAEAERVLASFAR
jgi:D-glycero-alpha-D-manno-heptose 1-phosphate guanylyltransferase